MYFSRGHFARAFFAAPYWAGTAVGLLPESGGTYWARGFFGTPWFTAGYFGPVRTGLTPPGEVEPPEPVDCMALGTLNYGQPLHYSFRDEHIHYRP